MTSIRSFAILFALVLPIAAGAMPPPVVKFPQEGGADTSAFLQYMDVSAPEGIKTPTIVDVPLDGRVYEYRQFFVVDQTTNAQVGSQFFERTMSIVPSVRALVDRFYGAMPYSQALVDGDYSTTVLFGVPEGGKTETVVTLEYSKPITASAMVALLDSGVMMPETVKIVAGDGEQRTVVYNTGRMTGRTVMFPKTTAQRWTVTFVHSQPLVLRELSFNDLEAMSRSRAGLRFVAEPGHQYRIYLNPDRYVMLPYVEAGNYANDEDVVRLAPVAAVSNPRYRLSDVDADGIPDVSDNCPTLMNPLQEDKNQNGKGDTCEDFDRDGIMNDRDNCPSVPNWDQRDTDVDGAGDACDEEESRFTEKHKWVPWVGIGTAGLVIVVLFVLVARKPAMPEVSESPTDTSAST